MQSNAQQGFTGRELQVQSGLGHRVLYCIFRGKQVSKILSEYQFDALLDGDEPLDGLVGNIPVAYVVASDDGYGISLVLFNLPLNSQGFCLDGWNLPLQRLADTAGPGPNLGIGRIRLACFSQCSISFHKDSLWDPSHNTFSNIKRALAVYFKALRKDAEISKVESPVENSKEETFTQEMHALRRELRNESAAYRNQLQVLQQEVERQRLLNERLVKNEQAKTQGESLKGDSRLDLHVLRQQNQRLNMKLRELKLSNEKLRKQHPPLLTKTVQAEEDALSNPDFILNKMAENDVVSVVFHKGIGHINLKPLQLTDYLEDPIAYAAHQVSLNKEQYQLWLEHENKPKCCVCDDAIPLVADPSIFDVEVDVYCEQHKP
jgi:hypothetical protein